MPAASTNPDIFLYRALRPGRRAPPVWVHAGDHRWPTRRLAQAGRADGYRCGQGWTSEVGIWDHHL